MSLYLLDTDTLSFVIKRREPVISNARKHSQRHSQVAISIVTYYEVLRGLRFSGATTQLRLFNRFVANNIVFELNEAVAKHVADIHATLRRQGTPLADADLLIGATAVAHNIPLVTNNTAHFQRIRNLALANWMTP